VDSDIFWTVSGFNNIVIGAIGGRIKFRSRGTPDVIEVLLKKPSEGSNDGHLADPKHKLLRDNFHAFIPQTLVPVVKGDQTEPAGGN
jgi:hypothetical protein